MDPIEEYIGKILCKKSKELPEKEGGIYLKIKTLMACLDGREKERE